MIPTDPATRAAWATYTAENERAANAYRDHPTASTLRQFGPTSRRTCPCGARTRSAAGICLRCRTRRNQEKP